jgi:S-adenosylmethionine hydrolase
VIPGLGVFGAMIQRVVLVTDFGIGSPYVGQMRCVVQGLAPQVPVVDLIADLPPFWPELAAYLLPALVRDLPSASLYLCVVDPGVGGPRDVVLLEAAGNYYLSPDNGLLAILGGRASDAHWARVTWRPARLSNSFHGRDLFAPAAARLALGQDLPRQPLQQGQWVGADWNEDMAAIIYSDWYGNLMTGWRADRLPRTAQLRSGDRILGYARTFCEVAPGTAFWYENAFGLVEIAVNQGHAGRVLGLDPGDAIEILA